MLNNAHPTQAAPEGKRAGRGVMLLIEPNLVARRTVAAVVTELGMARIEEAPDAQAGAALLDGHRYTALLIDMGKGSAALELIARVRRRQTACDPRMPVVALAAEADAATRRRLAELDVEQLLVRPFKVRAVLEVLRALQPPGETN